MIATAKPRPIARYPGSKFRIGEWVVSHFPAHRIYVAPFCGAAGELMHKERSSVEILNDLEGEIVNLHRVLRDPEKAAALAELVYLTPYSRLEAEDAQDEQADLSDLEMALNLLIRTTMSNASKGLINRSGFDTRINKDYFISRLNYWHDYPGLIPQFTERLRGVVLEHRPALEVMAQYDAPETLTYLDPPYVRATRSGGKRYRFEMSDDEHRVMARAARNLQGYCLISGYQSELYQGLFEARGWTRVEKSSYSDGGNDATECLWLNPRTVQALQRGLFGGLT